MSSITLRATHSDAQPLSQRALSTALVVGVHLALGYAALQIDSVRESIRESAPMFASIIVSDKPKPPEPPPRVRPVEKEPPPLIVAEAMSDDPPVFVAPPPQPVTLPPLEPPALSVPLELAQPPASAEPVPKLVSGVQYLRPPALEYPAASRRLNEQGRMVVRVQINAQGRAEQVVVQTSSGFARLDVAAIKAVAEALYKPYTENGVAIPVWAIVPLAFSLSE